MLLPLSKSRDAWELVKQPGLTGTSVSNAGNALAIGAGAANAGGLTATQSLAAAASGPGGAAAATDAAAAAGPLGVAFALGAASASGGLFGGPVNTVGAATAFGMLYYPSHSALQSCTFVLLL